MGKENQKKAKQWKKSKKVLELLLFAVPAGLVILGALIVIFAKNLSKAKTDKTEFFNFNLGASF